LACELAARQHFATAIIERFVNSFEVKRIVGHVADGR
jgi:hypothetical protein